MKPDMVNYDKFYKQYGIRTPAQIPNPPVHPLEELVLPKNSAFHWFGYEQSEQVGLAQDDLIAEGVKRYIYATNIEEYVQEDVVGNPKDIPLITTNMTREYFTKNKKIKRLKNGIESVNDPYSLVVYNYGLLNDHYRYTGISEEIDRWHNYYRTVYNNIAREVKKSDRNHFVEFDVPAMIPPLSILKQCEEGVDIKVARKITSDEWSVAELFHLITTDYKAYIFKDIAHNPDVLIKVNLILKCGDVFSVVNLGELIGWGNTDETQREKNRKKIANRFLRGLLSLRTNLTVGVVDGAAPGTDIADIYDGGDEEEEDNNEASRFKSTVEVDDDEEEVTTKSVTVDPFDQLRKTETSPIKVNEDELKEEIPEEADIDEVIEEELNQLEEYNEAGNLSGEIDGYTAYKPESRADPSIGAVKHAKHYAEIGLMTPAEVNRIKKISQKVNNISSPIDPNKSLVESVKISQEELKVNNVQPLVGDIHGLSDKSMSSSTLTVFDEKYIKNTMQKDIANMVLNLQRGGIMITDYKVEEVANIKDEYRLYKVKVHPVGGSPSTISFKLPVVRPDGTFIINEGRYRTRKQRNQLPISKTAPSEVALTSYYSKMFVYRSPRKQYNYTAWLVNSIVAASLTDDDQSSISDVKLNNVSNNDILLPRAYTAIAQKVASFKTSNATWYFDVSKVEKNFGIDWLEGSPIPVAKFNDDRIICLKDNDYIVELVDPNTGKYSDPIEHISVALGLDSSKKPTDYVETKIFGKSIPVGIILGYQLGFGNLLATSGKHFKKMGRRERYTLEPNEWALNFKDYKLIFNENNTHSKIASLIMAGFLRVDKVLTNRSLYDLDKRISYNALLDALKVPPRYLKEIPLMFDLWVDPITEEVLTEMGEPTDLVQLFIRASEMLLDDRHNDPTDVAYMRDKGYERHAGLMYGELIKAMRAYNAKPIKPTNKLEINPEAVWAAVTRDSSNDAVRELNPIHELKEQENVVYRGEGGRSSQSMMAKDRTFHRNSLGSTSEATVDNGDTGTIVYTTFNPNYTSIRGLTKPAELDEKNRQPSQLISTSMLLSPAAENDDKNIA